MRTATATDPSSDDRRLLLQLRVLEDSARQAAGWRYRLRALELHLIRWRLRKLMTPH